MRPEVENRSSHGAAGLRPLKGRRRSLAPCGLHSLRAPGALATERFGPQAGFTVMELLVSVAIITLLMGALFTFMMQAQLKVQGGLVVTQSNQRARAGMELMTQEIGQAGFNPQFANQKTDAAAITASATAQCVTLSDINGINPGDYLTVDTGGAYELVQVLATTNGALSGQTKCAAGNQISAVFSSCHGTAAAPCSPCPTTTPPQNCSPPISFTSYKFPFPSGILQGQTVSFNGSNITVSNDHFLAFYGNIENPASTEYVVYSLYNSTNGTPPQVTINGTNYNLYTLYRSTTPVTFDSTSTSNTNTHASPLVDNVLYTDITGASPLGPTGQPVFSYPPPVPVAIIPNTVSVVGTVIVNLCVAVNPKSLETGGQVQWYTMATQIRPVNLWSAVTVNSAGGAKYLPPTPAGLPMAFPSPIANYYF